MKTLNPVKPSAPACALEAIPGYKNNPQQLQQYINTSWLAACTILWNGKQFTSAEQQQTMQHIRSFLLNAPGLDAGYTELVQRLILGRQALPSDYGRVRTRPSVWLSPDYQHGFYATQKAYERLLRKRSRQPLYRIGLRSLADALLDMYQQPSAANYHYWRSWFQQRNSNFLLNILLAFIANRCNQPPL